MSCQRPDANPIMLSTYEGLHLSNYPSTIRQQRIDCRVRREEVSL